MSRGVPPQPLRHPWGSDLITEDLRLAFWAEVSHRAPRVTKSLFRDVAPCFRAVKKWEAERPKVGNATAESLDWLSPAEWGDAAAETLDCLSSPEWRTLMDEYHTRVEHWKSKYHLIPISDEGDWVSFHVHGLLASGDPNPPHLLVPARIRDAQDHMMDTDAPRSMGFFIHQAAIQAKVPPFTGQSLEEWLQRAKEAIVAQGWKPHRARSQVNLPRNMEWLVRWQMLDESYSWIARYPGRHVTEKQKNDGVRVSVVWKAVQDLAVDLGLTLRPPS